MQREQQCTNSCLTLSQFANSTNDLNVNTILIFWPGKHTLDSNITIFDIRQLLLVSNHSLKSPHIAEILCDGINGFRFLNIDSLRIHGLEFFGCFFRIVSVTQVLLKTSNFNSVNDSQSAMRIINSSVTIFRSNFCFNLLGSSQDDYRVGGAIISTASNLIVLESLFKENRAELGGAIYSEQGSNVSITNSTFIANHVMCLRRGISCYGGVLCSHISIITI